MTLFGTRTYQKIKRLNSRHRIIQGGQGAGKNWAIGMLLLEKAAERKRIITIVTDTFENLKDGAIQDYRNMFDLCGKNFDDYYNKQEKNLIVGKSIIQFRYIAGHKKQAGKSKRRDILYINETTKISYSAAQHYIARTAEEVYYDLNPDTESWVHTEIEPLPNAEKIIVTFRDNEKIPEAEQEYIESRRYDENGNETMWYRVYGRGETGFISEGLIYRFKVAELPEGAKRLASGMDFGTSPDPCVLVDLYLYGVDLYIDEVFSENGLLARRVEGAEQLSVVDRLNQENRNKEWPIVGDSSGKIEILDIHEEGYYIMPVAKKKDSVINGIKLMRSYRLHFTPRSKNAIKGAEGYKWKEDHNGKYIQTPDGHEPDALAAARYALTGSKVLDML